MNLGRIYTWGEVISLEYGKSLKGYQNSNGEYQVFGSNGAIGWTDKPLCKGPGIILGRKGAYRGVNFSEKDFYVIDTAYYVVPKIDLDLNWLYYAIKYHKLGEIDDGSPIPSTTRAAVYVREVEIPAKEVQIKIGNILRKLDLKINLNHQISQNLESIAQSIFKSWFIDFEPVKAKIQAKLEGKDSELAAMCAISGKSEAELQQMDKIDFAELQAMAALFPDELMNSELGKVPKEWGVQSLYDTAEFVNGAAFKAKDFSSNTNEGLPIIKIAELKQGLSAQTKYTTLSFDKKYYVRSGDIFYSWSGSPETSLDIFKWFGGDGWLNQHIFKINTKSKGQTYFVYYLLKYLKPTLIRLATNKQTTGLGHITVADMKQLQVIKPKENLFLRYIKMIAPLYEKESLLKQETIDLALVRDTLLPKLLSGELDVSTLNEVIHD